MNDPDINKLLRTIKNSKSGGGRKSNRNEAAAATIVETNLSSTSLSSNQSLSLANKEAAEKSTPFYQNPIRTHPLLSGDRKEHRRRDHRHREDEHEEDDEEGERFFGFSSPSCDTMMTNKNNNNKCHKSRVSSSSGGWEKHKPSATTTTNQDDGNNNKNCNNSTQPPKNGLGFDYRHDICASDAIKRKLHRANKVFYNGFLDKRDKLKQGSVEQQAHATELQHFLKSLWLTKTMCDLCIIVGNQKYPAHKLALAMYSRKYREEFEKQLHIKDSSVYTICLKNSTNFAVEAIIKV